MKRSLLLSLTILLFGFLPASAQLGGLMNRVANSVADEITGNRKSSTPAKTPEPDCACSNAEVIVNLGGKLQLDYSETEISTREDGAILLKDKPTGNFYIAKDGSIQGPIPEGDKRLAGFEVSSDEAGADAMMLKFQDYISKSGEKYNIKFNGKTYGPYAEIRSFAVTKSKDKFAAMIIENILATEDEGEAMDKAMKNAKSDQERMDLAMQFSMQMQQRMMANGDPTSTTPKLISNIEGATYDPITGGEINGKIKYDDILFLKYNSISDIKGKQLFSLKPEQVGVQGLFVNTSNTALATYNYGTLTFSDNKILKDLFNPQLVKGADGKIYLAYMYYSPGKNSIMQCKVPF